MNTVTARRALLALLLAAASQSLGCLEERHYDYKEAPDSSAPPKMRPNE